VPNGRKAVDPRPAARDAQIRAIGALRLHREAERVPAMPPAAYRAFRADIERRGIQVPLEISVEGVVLDGRERLRAASELGLERVPVRLVTPDDELEYMYLAALERRQLSASQRAALAVELERYRELRAAGRARQRANLRQNATERATLPPLGRTREQAAAWAGVSARTLQDAATVQAYDPALFAQVKQGKLAAAVAARRLRRARRDASLPPPAALPDGLFSLLYADPPLQLGNPDGPWAPENHYPTMALEEIATLQIPAGDDAVLFLWAVPSQLPQALALMAAWGFDYKGEIIWVKPSIGLGRWLRYRHESLLIACRGRLPAPEPEDLPASVIEAPRGRHSEKPVLVYELIERMYPGLSKLELFARGAPRPGWTAWGNEVAQ
jgi:N6-adenosine-specific RNA methylase IME4